MNRSDKLGTKPIGSLLLEQAVPASIGILIMSIYGIVDTIFVGKWVGALAIGAVTVVMPISFLMSSIGMAIGVGGASMISRALGANDQKRAFLTFGNQVSLTILLSVVFVSCGYFFQDYLLMAFGGRGDLLEPTKEYFQILLFGVPFLAWAMMSNNVIRAEGKPRMAMMIMIVPAIVNIVLDPIFIVWFGWGLKGAALATSLSYMASAGYAVWFFWRGSSEIKLKVEDLKLRLNIVGEIFSIGGVTLARQGTISVLSIVLNNVLFNYGGEMGVSVYGIINRMMMFANFPVLGITQGFLPIASYNYGAQNWKRVKEVIKRAIIYGTALSLLIFSGIMLLAPRIPYLFTDDPTLIGLSSPALLKVFLATPLLTIQLIGSAYFQAIGKALPALILSLLKQGIFLVPLVLLLPNWMGLEGVWYAFPIADVLTAIVNLLFLRAAFQRITTDPMKAAQAK